jgi:hypothetical protein
MISLLAVRNELNRPSEVPVESADLIGDFSRQ